MTGTETDEQAPVAPNPDTTSTNAADNDPLLTAYLARDEAHCPICRYNLHGLRGNICPECGHAFRLGLASVYPAFGSFLVAVIPLAMLAGIAALLGVICVIQGPPPFPEYWGIHAMIVGGFVGLLAVVIGYAKRTHFLRLKREYRLLIAWLLWLATVGFVTLSLLLGAD